MVYGLFIILKQFFEWRIVVFPKKQATNFFFFFNTLEVSQNCLLIHQKVDLLVTVLISKVRNHPVIVTDNYTLVARAGLFYMLLHFPLEFKYENMYKIIWIFRRTREQCGLITF